MSSKVSSPRGCCLCTSYIFATIFCSAGLIIILGGFMRITLNNQQYQAISCTVENTEVREIRGVCVANKCSPSHWNGNVEFKLSNGKEIWTLVISSYDELEVRDFMASHFSINSETQCYLNKKNDELLFQLPSTTALLVISILFLLLGFFMYGLVCCCLRHRKGGYTDLDNDEGVGL